MFGGDTEDRLYSTRSFFGVLRVEKDSYDRDGETIESHKLVHGSTLHGEQSTDPQDAREPWTYYHRTGPVGEVFEVLNDRSVFQRDGRIGVVGLGTGSVAAYAEKGQSLTYFEIDSKVRNIAEDPRYFTYLSSCRERIGDDLNIRMGDARLTLKDKQYDDKFDVLLIDAFSSDAIPIHLITCEAVEMYFQKLAPRGLLMVHLSNRHLDLEPVVAASAEKLGLVARIRDDDDKWTTGKSPSTWAVLARRPKDLGRLMTDKDPYLPEQLKWKPLRVDPGFRLWTDDYSSIVSVMNWEWLPAWKRRSEPAETAKPADAADDADADKPADDADANDRKDSAE